MMLTLLILPMMTAIWFLTKIEAKIYLIETADVDQPKKHPATLLPNLPRTNQSTKRIQCDSSG